MFTDRTVFCFGVVFLLGGFVFVFLCVGVGVLDFTLHWGAFFGLVFWFGVCFCCGLCGGRGFVPHCYVEFYV
jgi:hypothetical protein